MPACAATWIEQAEADLTCTGRADPTERGQLDAPFIPHGNTKILANYFLAKPADNRHARFRHLTTLAAIAWWADRVNDQDLRAKTYIAIVTLTDRYLAEGDDTEKDLLTAMWLVATYQYPDLELEKLRQELEQIYYETWLEFKPDLYPIDQIKVVNSVLFNKLKFGANTKNFHSPGNSMINVVLETRKGNPITLCVIYMLVAQKLKLPVQGVNLPNLFILT